MVTETNKKKMKPTGNNRGIATSPMLMAGQAGCKIEVWKPIPDYEHYECSNHGRVKRLKGHSSPTEKIYIGSIGKRGFYKTTLSKNGNPKSFQISILVAKLFLENPKGYTNVGHIDRDKANNKAENLKWIDRYEAYWWYSEK